MASQRTSVSAELEKQRHPTALRLLLVSRKPPPYGGIAHWTLLLTAWLQSRGDIAFRFVDTAARSHAVDDLNIPKRLIGGAVWGVRDAWRVIVQLIRFRPEVIHLTTSGSVGVLRDIVVLSLARLFGARAVYHIRFGRIPELARGRGWEWRLLRCAMRLAHIVLAIDSGTEAALRGVLPREKLALVPNLIVLDPARPREVLGTKGTRTIYYLGWLMPTKGMRELVEAWRVASQDGWELKIAGPGDPNYRLELAKCAGDKTGLEFLDELPHSQGWALMQQTDIFVLPSYIEGFPNVVLEAMAAGKAIIATRVGAIPEMLDAESGSPCGLVVAPRDVPGLAQALTKLMNDPALRSDLGRRARAKIERCYEARVVFARYLETWRSLAVAPPNT